MVETTGLVGPDHPLQPESLDFLFKEGMQPLRALIGAAASRIIFWPLIDANEDMMRKA
jgi:hypothetical protein